MSVTLYEIALLCGIATVRATVIMIEHSVKDRSRSSRSSAADIAGYLLRLSAWFLIYPWWIPVVAGFAMAFLVGLIVIRATHAFFYKAVPVTASLRLRFAATVDMWAGA